MEASEFGVNSPEFLQRKIERLKTALEEANVLMDRHVTERDEARAQMDSLKRENSDLRRELEAARAAAEDAPPADAPALDPALEQELRDRIAALESEREGLQGEVGDARAAAAGSDDRELLARVATLSNELDAARRDADEARSQAAAARADAVAARADADAAHAASMSGAAAGAQPPGGQSDRDLPAPGPFVPPEVIRAALANDDFVLFCQPVFSLQAERITQYELLLRLRDADGRMVRPFGFLEPADRYGLMSEIDRWVVGHALDLLARDATGDLRLEVNIAGQTLGDPELTDLIEQQIAVTDLDPARLILEVSENVAVAHLDDCRRLAKMLRGLGCGFAIDDFGSTFASFRHLRDLPVNFLKIDGDLVVTVTESRTGQLTIKSLVELAKGLGAETIAEYVSDDQTLEFLREQGVGYAQGYRIGRPRPIDEVLGNVDHPRERPKRVERPALASGGDEGAETETDEPVEQRSDY
jgi:EAL domain-containing protein (putative c-di-GMP-specific phosphodiesterase class I)